MIRDELLSIINTIINREFSFEKLPSVIDLSKDLHMDSLQIIEMIVEIENNYNFIIKDEYLSAEILTDFNKLVDVIEKERE